MLVHSRLLFQLRKQFLTLTLRHFGRHFPQNALFQSFDFLSRLPRHSMVLYFEDVKVAKVTVEILSVPAVNILMFGVKVAAS